MYDHELQRRIKRHIGNLTGVKITDGHRPFSVHFRPIADHLPLSRPFGLPLIRLINSMQRVHVTTFQCAIITMVLTMII